MISDLLSVLGSVICLCGFLPVLFGNRSGWEIIGLTGYRYFACLVTILAWLNSFLLRLCGHRKYSRFCCALLNGLIFYWMTSNLPLNVLFQE